MMRHIGARSGVSQPAGPPGCTGLPVLKGEAMDRLRGIARDEKSLLNMELLRLHDDLTAFSEECAFFCDAFVAIVACSNNFEVDGIGGFERNAHRLKRKAIELKERLQLIRGIEANTWEHGCMRDR